MPPNAVTGALVLVPAFTAGLKAVTRSAASSKSGSPSRSVTDGVVALASLPPSTAPTLLPPEHTNPLSHGRQPPSPSSRHSAVQAKNVAWAASHDVRSSPSQLARATQVAGHGAQPPSPSPMQTAAQTDSSWQRGSELQAKRLRSLHEPSTGNVATTGTHAAGGASHGRQPLSPSSMQTAGQAHDSSEHWPSNSQLERSRPAQRFGGWTGTQNCEVHRAAVEEGRGGVGRHVWVPTQGEPLHSPLGPRTQIPGHTAATGSQPAVASQTQFAECIAIGQEQRRNVKITVRDSLLVAVVLATACGTRPEPDAGAGGGNVGGGGGNVGGGGGSDDGGVFDFDVSSFSSFGFGPVLAGSGQCISNSGFCFDFPQPVGFSLTAMGASSPGTLWFGAGPGGVVRHDDAGWALVPIDAGPIVAFDFRARDVGVALSARPGVNDSQVLRYDGITWVSERGPESELSKYAVALLSDAGVLVGGGGFSGFLFLPDAGGWWPQYVGADLVTQVMRSGDDTDWLAGRDLIQVRSAGTSSARLPGSGGSLSYFRSATRTPGGIFWVGSPEGLYSGAPGAWVRRLDAGVTLGAASSSDTDVWAAIDELSPYSSGPQLWRWDGTNLARVDAGLPLVPLAAFSASNAVFTVKGRAQLARFDGSRFVTTPWEGFDGTPTFVTGTGADDVWSVAFKGLFHFDGSGWRFATVPRGVQLYTFAFAVERRGVAWAWASAPGGHVLYRCDSATCVPQLKPRPGVDHPSITARGGFTWLSTSNTPTPGRSRPWLRSEDGGLTPYPELPGFWRPVAAPDGGLWASDSTQAEVHELVAGAWVQRRAPSTNANFAQLTLDAVGTPVLYLCLPSGCQTEVWSGSAFARTTRPDGGAWGRAFSGEFPSNMWMVMRAPVVLHAGDGGLEERAVRGLSPSEVFMSEGHVFLTGDGAMLHLRP